MNDTPRFFEPPADSSSAYLASDADFIDCRKVLVANTECSALGYTLQMLADGPGWAGRLMAPRMRWTSIDFGKSDADYQLSERIGCFTLTSLTMDEVLLSDWGYYFDVYLVLNRLPVDVSGRRPLVLSILMRSHSRLGRLYSFSRLPFCKYLASRMLATTP